MSKWIIDARGGVCEQCDESYRSLSLHWSRNQTCSYPSVEDSLQGPIRGCPLGDGSLDAPNTGPPALRISSMRRDHIEWLHDCLGWLSRGVTRDGRDAYRLRTMSHPVFGRYWTWHGAPPTKGWRLTRGMARIWYACDGSLEWPGGSTRPRVQWTISDERKRDAIHRVLTDLGYQPMVWERRIALPIDATEQWLAWLGSPSPGSEYKWSTEKAEYDSRRTQYTKSNAE